MYKFSKRSLDNLQGVHPKLAVLMKNAIADSPVDFTITCGVRTTAQQQAEYAKGRTKPGKTVTEKDGIKNKSKHQVQADGYGHAVDLYPYFLGQVQVNHKDTVPRLRDIAAHIKKRAAELKSELGISITWGGDWGWDFVHFELKNNGQ
jgi:peptidoglycan L-alanyl-D-glutamate endopeptidase CwlK